MNQLTPTPLVLNDGHDTEAIWASLYARPDKAKLFIDFMERVTDMHSSVIVSSYNFSSNRLVIDVGGGRASLISAVLKAYPHLRGVVVDLPHMKTEVSLRLDSEGLTERCSFSEGNFLEHVPAGGDVYIIKHVLHDWPDTEVSTILSNISKVMNENDVLIIIEGLIHEENGNEELLKLQNLERMLLTDGRERSEDEFNSLLMGVELRLAEVRYTSFNDCCLIIARKNKH